MAEPILFSRTSKELHDACTRTARRLGLSAGTYIERCVLRGIAEDADKVALADQEHSEEIARLSREANSLIALTNRTRGRS